MLKNKRLIAIVVLMILFCIVAIFINTKTNLIIDDKIYNVISMLHSNIATIFFKAITILGNGKIIGCLCIMLLLLNKTRNIIGIPVSIVTSLSGILNIMLKNIFERQRPLLDQLVYEDSFSFPSGHSMATATIYSMIIYLSCKYIKNKKLKYLVNILSVMLIFLIGISRIYLRVHYFTDVIAGWILGIVIVLMFSIIEEKIQNKKESKDV